MADLPTTPPLVHADNITGSPLTTVGGIVAGVGQYLATQGGAWPHDTQGWIQLVLGLVISVGGMFLRSPLK